MVGTEFNSRNCTRPSCLGRMVINLRQDIWEVVAAYEKLRKGSSEQDVQQVDQLPNLSSCIKEGLARSDKVGSHVLLITTLDDNIYLLEFC